MKIASVLVLAVVTSSFCPLKAQNPSPTPATSALSSNQSLITNQDVIALLKAGLSAEIVAAKIKNSRCQCDTSPAGLEQLKTAAVPDNVIMAMVESSVPATPTQPSGLNDIREARTVYLVNDTTDMKVFNGFSEKLHEWGRWRVVERPEDADLLLIFSGSNRYVGSMSTANVNASATYMLAALV